MKMVTFTDFRKNASHLLDDVENGETVVVLRHGRPVAEVSPVSSSPHQPAWKQPSLRLEISGAELASAIIGERKDESVL
jgi:prevent-host-death family protein